MAFNKEKVMDAARKFVDKGQLDKAIKEYLRVVKEDPQDVRVWLKVGDLYAKKGSKQEASETYLKVARFYQDQGFFLKAVAVYKQILKLDPRLVEVNLKLAELYRQLGLLSDAMQHFESVAAHFHREGKTKEALATVRQLVDLDPENIATRIKLAELYSKEAMNAEAVTEFQVACDQLRKQNRVDDFLKVAERLLWHKADNLPLNRELAVLYLRRNDPRRALQKLQACFKADPRDVETLALLAQAFQALDQKSKTVSVLKELARVFDENKQREKAEEVHRKILQFVPTDPDSLAYLGQKAKVADKFKPVPTPPPVQPPPDAAPRPARLNFTSEVAALQSQEPRMTGSMPLVEAQDFALPDYDGGDLEPEVDGDADFSADLGDDAFARGESSAGELHADEISKILTETDVYIKYGLHQKAIDHLRRVFALDADNLEARERLKEVLVSQGREREAVGELMKLAESVAAHDPDRAEGYLREVLSIDGAYRPALELARRFRLDLSGDPAEIDLDSAEIRAGAVAAVDDDLDFDGIDFGESSRRDVPLARADSFDGIDPEMFQPAAQGSPPGGVRGAAIPGVRPSPMADNTRQIAASEVEALAAMSSAPRSIEFEDGVVETPAPQLARPAWQQAHRSLDDVLDEQLDDSLGEDIDEDVARELSGAMPAPQFELPPDAGYEQLPPDSDVDVQALGAPIIPIGPMDELDDELPFDPAAARAFDAGLRPGSAPAGAAPQTGDVPPTFDPAAAAAFDADRPDLPYAPPTAADLGAAPSDRFDPMGLESQPAPYVDPLGDAALGHYDAGPAYPDDAGYAEGQYAEGQYAEGQYAEGQYAEGQYAEGQYAEGQYAEGQYAEGQYAEGQYAEGQYAEGQYAEGQYAEGQYAEGAYAEPGYAPEPDAGYATDDAAFIHDPSGAVQIEPSRTVDIGPAAELAAQYDGGYTVDAPVDGGAAYQTYDEPGAHDPAGYVGATVDAPYDEAYEAPAPRAASSLEDDLDEVDFYVSQDMLVEAADLLRNLLGRYPAHPLITAKLRDVESQAGGYVADGFATPPVAEIDPDAIEEELHVDSGGTQNIDVDELEELDPDALAEMIEDHELLEEPAVPDVAPVAHAKPAVMLEKPIEDNDAETHYDLGLAYKEMGLWDEAIKAFDKVMANPAREVQCRLMIGLCRRDQGNPSEAVHSFKAALHAPQVNEREKLGLLYEIGITYEAMGDAREALYYFEGVLKRDAAFLDVADRVAALRGAAKRRGGGGGGDDADAALDSLLHDDL